MRGHTGDRPTPLYGSRYAAIALRCYAAAGFEPAGPDQAAAWNACQPIDYVWFSLVT
jgi:hypothetical protein